MPRKELCQIEVKVHVRESGGDPRGPKLPDSASVQKVHQMEGN